MNPEIADGKRCKLVLRTNKNGKMLSIILTSGDLISLRAGLNTNLRLAVSALKSINAAKSVDSSEKSQKD
jgi:tRNA threonylcarbamoyladenosine modification (KEOPS) complex  Pcc1 subunit